jgi:heat shock protein HslJ
MKIFTVSLLTALVAASCSGSGSANESPTTLPAVPSDVSLGERGGSPADGDWQLVEGVPQAQGFPITLSIAGSNVSGRAACNTYGGMGEFDSGEVSFSEFFQTAMACEPAAMDAEMIFMAALASVDAYTVSDTRLTLFGSDVELVFEPVIPVPTAGLVGTVWILETLIEGETASTVGGDPATLLLAADGALTASTGCRALTGTWLENGGVIVVPTLSADGECPSDLSRQDSLVVTVVGDEFRAETEGNRLTLTSMGGDGLVYRAEG